MLVGPITKEIKELLKEEVSKVYMKTWLRQDRY
jgi:hypothetical protein